jgi:hypothetical protein
MTTPNPGAVASLAEYAAQIINRAVAAGEDSTGQGMVKVRAELLVNLQRALADVYPDTRDHNATVANALARRTLDR